jgi:peptidyl-dipeptidase A
MNSKTIAGLGMMLLAAGLLTIYFLGVDITGSSTGPDDSNNDAASEDAAAQTVDQGPHDVNAFLDQYNATFKNLWTDSQAARWAFASNQTESLAMENDAARRRLYDYTGSRGVIDKLKQFRGRLDLNRLQDRQIERAWRLASLYPATSAQSVFQLMELEAAMTDSLQSIAYLSTRLALATKPSQKLVVWEKAQTLGPNIKDDLVQTRDLRNSLAQSMGYSSYFALAADRYGMQGDELLQLLENLTTGVAPLYQQLHCFFNHESAAPQGSETPRLIPAHLVPSMDGTTWPMAGTTDPIPTRMDSLFLAVQPQWILEQAESFHTSLGFAPLPLGFWGRSNLYLLPAGSQQTKSHTNEAWHMDLDQDVRALMNVTADFTSYGEAHRVLAQTYYQLAVSREEVPPTLRQGANPAFVPALGILMQMAGCGTPSLLDTGLMSPGNAPDVVEVLLYRAMHESVIKIPLLCGTLAHWEYDFYENELPRHLFNTRWWEYSEKYQGIEPPVRRGEMDCTPAVSNDVVLNPTGGMDQALAMIIAHQLHRYICKTILNEDVRLANYRGRTDVGRYLQSVMQLGATKDWMQVMREATGEELSSDALMEYYQPLYDWLSEQNAGKEVDFSVVPANQ